MSLMDKEQVRRSCVASCTDSEDTERKTQTSCCETDLCNRARKSSYRLPVAVTLLVGVIADFAARLVLVLPLGEH